MNLGENIQLRRIELGLTQAELAKRLGLKSKASISSIEKNKEDLTVTRLIKIAEALETTPTHLMGGNIKPGNLAKSSFRLNASYNEYIKLLHSNPKMPKLLNLLKEASPEDINLIITTLKHLPGK